MIAQDFEELSGRVVRSQEETQRELQTTAQTIRGLSESLAQEAEQRRREAEQRQLEAEQRRQEEEWRKQEEEEQRRREDEQRRLEADQRSREADRRLKELGAQIGGLGEKFGSFTEGMAFPSMRRILEERFHMSVIGTRMIGRNNGHRMEIDVLAYSNRDRDEVYIVEVKSHLREDGLQRMLQLLRDFHRFFPGHDGKKVYGILACVDAPEQVAHRVLEAGVYLAQIHDGQFEIKVPDGFQPRAF
jgi:hypothetical protein